MSLQEAISSLRKGDFILLHDESTRENEVDMVVAADLVTPEHISRMRQDAGGLICLSINYTFATSLGLNYMHDILFNSQNMDVDSKRMIIGTAPYGDRPSFSISINHMSTFTGPTRKTQPRPCISLSRSFAARIARGSFAQPNASSETTAKWSRSVSVAVSRPK